MLGSGLYYIYRVQPLPRSVSKYVLYPQKNSVPVRNHCLPTASYNHSSVCINLLVLDISYKWSRTFCGRLCPASFGCVAVVACFRISFLFINKLCSVVWRYHVLFVHSSTDGHLSCSIFYFDFFWRTYRLFQNGRTILGSYQ